MRTCLTSLAAIVLLAALLAGCKHAPTGQAPTQSTPSAAAADTGETDTRPLREQIGGTYDADNGYVDFLDAAEIIRTHPKLQGVSVYALTDAEKEQLLADADIQRALALVRRGIAKPIRSVRSGWDLNALFTEMAPFRSLGYLLAAQEHAAVEQGDLAAATEALEVLFDFARGIRMDGLISDLVANAVLRANVSRMGRDVDRLDAAACDRVLAICNEWLANPPSLRRALDEDKASLKRSFRYILNAGPERFGEDEDGGIYRILARMGRNPAQAARLAQQQDRMLDAHWERLYAEMEKPLWERKEVEPPELPTPLGIWLVIVAPMSSGLWNGHARIEAYARVLGTEALIRKHLLQHGKLPASLADLDAADLTQDPFSGKRLRYEVSGETFKLSSIGPERNGEHSQPITLHREE